MEPEKNNEIREEYSFNKSNSNPIIAYCGASDSYFEDM